MSQLVSTLEAITPEWMSGILQVNLGLVGQTVTSIESTLIGTGKMGDNARLALTYSGEGNGPATMVVKIPAREETARMMAGGMGAYTKEVCFYRDLAGQTSMRIPEIYHADINKEGTEFVLLMQDLMPAEPGSQLVGERPERSLRAVIEAAKLHAAFLNREDILTQGFVTQNTPEGAALGQQLLQQNWPGFLDRFSHGLNQACIDLGTLLVENYQSWAQRFDGATTLVHGDFRSENLLFLESGAPYCVDWQTIQRSSPLADVSYFMGGSVDVEERRACEQSIVDAYRAEFNELGGGISQAECWEQYREFSLHGILVTVLGAMFSGAEARSDQMFLAMIQRHLQHAVDLQAEEFIT